MDALVTITGNVGGDVEFRSGNGLAIASFRLACTPRVRKDGGWTDGATTWLTITCFRTLAEHVAASVRKGDPLVVSGRLRTNQWTKDNVEHARLVLEASQVGHDLTWGTSAFQRSSRPDRDSVDRDDAVVAVITTVEQQSGAGTVEEGVAGTVAA